MSLTQANIRVDKVYFAQKETLVNHLKIITEINWIPQMTTTLKTVLGITGKMKERGRNSGMKCV